jgi:AcrR family transcriptional regulator
VKLGQAGRAPARLQPDAASSKFCLVAPRRKAEETRRRILDVAREVFFEDGFAAANLDEVARRANVAKGTVYRYFESKADLYVAVLARNADFFVQRMRSTVTPGLSAEEQIRAIGTFYFKHYSENRAYFRIFWAVENQRLLGSVPDQAVRHVTDVWKQCLEILATVIERGVAEGAFRPCDPWEMANILWIVANGIIQSDLDRERAELRGADLERVFADAVELVIRGLRAAD